MKRFKVITAIIFLMSAFIITGCKKDKDEPAIPQDTIKLSEGIVGNWLLASSTTEEWSTYDFKKSQQINAEWFADNILRLGSGMFFTNEEKSSLTATLSAGSGKEVYLDWIAKKIQAFQIDIEMYGGKDGNEFVGNNSLYKIVGEQEIEEDATIKIDYRKFTGTKECSDFVSLDESIVTVSADGGIVCKGSGNTFIVFSTPAGKAAIKIKALDKILTFAENMLGTWVTDVKGYMWERDVFGEDGYFYSQWSREVIFPTTNESAQGTYTIDEANKIIYVSAKTPYNQRLNVEYRITKIDKFSFDTDVYAGGDKTGVFYYQRVLSSVTVAPNSTVQPNYLALVGSSIISGYRSHEEKIATVDEETGSIKGISGGMTYIDVVTNNGTGVVEVSVDTN